MRCHKSYNGIALYMAENAYLNDTALDVLKMVASWLNEAPEVDAVEVSRLGKLGRLMMPYQGCPRGRFGERGCSGDGRAYFTVMELDAIVDVDGNRWIPVLDSDLDALKDKKKNAVEVVHGRWEQAEYHGFVRCDQCKDVYINEEWLEDGKWNYCPNCGADMRGDGNG